jgi:type IV pilus assembly protein PilQ
VKYKNNGRLLQQFAVFAAIALASFGALAQNAIENFNVSQQGGQVLVRITTKQPLAAPPASFTVATPARIAFDFPNTVNALGRTAQDVGQGELRSMNVVQVGDRTRMVLNLRNMVQHEAKVDGRNILITLTPGTSTAQAAPSRFAEGTADARHAVRDINFRRGRNGEGRIVVDLSDAGTGIDIRQQGQNLVIDFLKSTVAESLRKRLDVVDFATPVQSIATFPQGDNVRMVIEPRGLWEHNAYQTDSQFVVEVKPVQYDPNKLTQGTGTGYTGEKLSLNFQNVEVRSVLNVIADFTDLNIITSDTVQGNLTLRLKDVPWDQALDIILQTRGLDMRKNGNVVWIAPRDELATKEKIALESRQQITELEPVRTENFQLNYAKADGIAKLLSDDKQRILSKRGSAVVDARTNQVFVQDVPSRLEEVRRLIAKLDIPVRQVLIEARIVEANDTFSRNVGVRLGYGQRGTTDALGRNRPSNIGGELSTVGQLSGLVAGTPTFAGTGPVSVPASSQIVNLPAGPLSGFQPNMLSLILFNRNFTRFIDLEISALEADGKGKIISSPRVLTADNIEAVIEQGTELPYQQATSSGATSVSFRKANLALKVKPQITPDGNIIMTLDVNKDAVGQVTGSGFAIDTKHVKTEVLVENGGTVVIGGIYTQDTRSTTVKTPLFGDLPVVGALFRNNQRTDNKTELLLFITPRIVSERLGQR